MHICVCRGRYACVVSVCAFNIFVRRKTSLPRASDLVLHGMLLVFFFKKGMLLVSTMGSIRILYQFLVSGSMYSICFLALLPCLGPVFGFESINLKLVSIAVKT